MAENTLGKFGTNVPVLPPFFVYPPLEVGLQAPCTSMPPFIPRHTVGATCSGILSLSLSTVNNLTHCPYSHMPVLEEESLIVCNYGQLTLLNIAA
jgi:hypothetical protein